MSAEIDKVIDESLRRQEQDYITNFTFQDSKTNSQIKNEIQQHNQDSRNFMNSRSSNQQNMITNISKNLVESREKLAETCEIIKQNEILKKQNHNLQAENDDLNFNITELKFKIESNEEKMMISEDDFPMIARQADAYLFSDNAKVDPRIKKYLKKSKEKVDNLKKELEHYKGLLQGENEEETKPKTTQTEFTKYHKLKVIMGKNLITKVMKSITKRMETIQSTIGIDT